MPDLTISLSDDDYGLLKEAADSEYRSVAAYCLYIAMVKARKQTKKLAIRAAKLRLGAQLVTCTETALSKFVKKRLD